MRLPEMALFLALASASVAYAAQATQAQPASSQPVPAQFAAADQTSATSELLNPALDSLKNTLGVVRPEKWKGGTIRAEAQTNIASILRDLQSTLPGLIAESDAAPAALTKALPVARNLDALYDVLVRVVDGARVAARDQADELQQVMAQVEKARLALSDRLLVMASGSEKQIVSLQASLKAQPAPVCPTPAVVTPPPPPPTPKKKVVKKKPAAPAPAAKPQAQTPSKTDSQ